jgi:cytochrome c oxidase cbb3-type subunit 3
MRPMTRIRIAAAMVALGAALCGLTGVGMPAPPPALPANLARGQRTFLQHCAMCHGNGGQGDGELAATLRHREGVVVANLTDRVELERLTRAGVRRTIEQGGAHTGRSNLMPAWGGRLSHREIDDVADYVMHLPDMAPTVFSATLRAYLRAPPGAPAEGRGIFVHQCSVCHGLGGHGDGPLSKSLEVQRHVRPRNLTDSTFAASRTDRELFTVISQGGGPVGKSTYMPHWGGYLSPAQIKNLVSYIRVISHTAPRP